MKVLHFVTHHWILASAFVIVFLWLISVEARERGSGGRRLSIQQVTHKINREEGVIVDVREVSAFAEGHIVGAINVPLVDVDRENKRLEKYAERPLIIVCAAGQSSIGVVNKLTKLNYKKIFFLTGGMNAWKNAGMPVVQQNK